MAIQTTLLFTFICEYCNFRSREYRSESEIIQIENKHMTHHQCDTWIEIDGTDYQCEKLQTHTHDDGHVVNTDKHIIVW